MKAALGLLGIVILGALVAILVRVEDRLRTEDALRRAATTKVLAEQVIGEYSSAFTLRGINAISEVLTGPRGEALKRGLDECLKGRGLPRLFGDKRLVGELNVAIGQLVLLVKEPRGNWLSFMAETTTLRSALDGRILAVAQTIDDASGTTAATVGTQRAVHVVQEAQAEEQKAIEREEKERRDRMAQAERDMEARERSLAEENARRAALMQQLPPLPTPTAATRVDGTTIPPTPAEGYIGWSKPKPTPVLK